MLFCLSVDGVRIRLGWRYYQGCAYSVLRTAHHTVWGSSPFSFCYTFQTRGCIIKAVHIKRSQLSIILFGARVLSVSVTPFKPAPLYNSSENLKSIEILSADIAPSPSVVLMLVQCRRRWININPCNAGIFL